MLQKRQNKTFFANLKPREKIFYKDVASNSLIVAADFKRGFYNFVLHFHLPLVDNKFGLARPRLCFI